LLKLLLDGELLNVLQFIRFYTLRKGLNLFIIIKDTDQKINQL